MVSDPDRPDGPPPDPLQDLGPRTPTITRVRAQSLSQINTPSQIGSSPDLLSQNIFTNQKEPEKGPSPSPSPELAKSGNLTLFMKKFKFSKAIQDKNENRLKEITKRKI